MSILHVGRDRHEDRLLKELSGHCEGDVKRHGNTKDRIQQSNYAKEKLRVVVKHVSVPDDDIRISQSINMLIDAENKLMKDKPNQ